jgi:hypothetical protein
MVFKTSILRTSTVYIDGAVHSKMSASVPFVSERTLETD